MTDQRLRKWLVSANNDYRAAQSLLIQPEDKMITNVICYLSQQSAEKFLKAFLFFKEVPFSKTHNLEILLAKCIRSDATFPEINLSTLTSYNISMRYPDEFRIPSFTETKNSFEIATIVKQIILSKIEISESDLTLF